MQRSNLVARVEMRSSTEELVGYGGIEVEIRLVDGMDLSITPLAISIASVVVEARRTGSVALLRISVERAAHCLYCRSR